MIYHLHKPVSLHSPCCLNVVEIEVKLRQKSFVLYFYINYLAKFVMDIPVKIWTTYKMREVDEFRVIWSIL